MVANLPIKIVLENVLSVFGRYQLRVDQMLFPVKHLVKQRYAKGDDGTCLVKEITWVMSSRGTIESF